MEEKGTKWINKRILSFLLLIFSIIVVILGFVFDPSFVSKHLSADGILSKATIIKVYFMQSVTVAFGFLLTLYFIIKITDTNYAGIIDEKLRVFINKLNKKITSILILLRFVRKDDHSLLKRIVLAWLIFLLFAMVSGILDVCVLWQKKAVGWEYLWIAENIESGNGFSFADCNGSVRPVPGCEKYNPTAYEEPVYPFLMALASKVFGKYGRPVVLFLQVVALFFTSVFIYHLSLKVFNSPATGILAGSVLTLLPTIRHLAAFYFGPVIFAGLMIVILTYLILWCLEKVSLRRGIILGLTLGFTALLFSPALTFIPISAFLLLITKNPDRSIALKTAIAVFFTAVIVLSGWTIRNFLIFGHIVPVRTGFGINMLHSNPVLAESFTSKSSPGLKNSGLKWKARNAREAIILSYGLKQQGAIFKRSSEIIKQDAPDGYVYNEAERDRVALKKTLKFIFSQPEIFIALIYNKMYAYFFFFGLKIGAISLLFFISTLMTITNKNVRILVLLILAYSTPYFLALPSWYRYRYPIEPIILIVACYLPVLTFSKLYALYQKS